jgi:hypothetical protein
MRLWSLHPRLLDARGLVALWREALLAQAVLAGQTRGYTHHPQLKRFRSTPRPEESIAAYLRAVQVEATRRGYRFDASKVGMHGEVDAIAVSQGQLGYEWQHLRAKLRLRDPVWLAGLGDEPEPHPLFRVAPGPVADWEVVAAKKV